MAFCCSVYLKVLAVLVVVFVVVHDVFVQKTIDSVSRLSLGTAVSQVVDPDGVPDHRSRTTTILSCQQLRPALRFGSLLLFVVSCCVALASIRQMNEFDRTANSF